MGIAENIQDTLNKFKKHKDIKNINSFLVEFLTNYIQKEYEYLAKPVKQLFVFNREFYEKIISELPEFINDYSYYKEFEKLKKYYIIHPKSVSYPLSFRLTSINPNHKCLLQVNLKKLSEFKEFKESLKNKIILNKKLEDIYTYLRFLSIHPFNKNKLLQIKYSDIIKAKDDVAFIFFFNKNELLKLIDEDTEKQVQTYYLEKLDKFISQAILEFHNINSTMQIFNNEDKNISYFEEYAQKIRKADLDIEINQIKYLNQMDFLQESNGLKLSLESKISKSVQSSIKEIQAIYPNCKISDLLLRVEEKLYNYIFNYTNNNDESEDINEEEVIYLNIYDIPKLKYFLKTNSNSLKEYNEIKNIINEYLSNSESSNAEIVKQYLFELLDRNHNKNNFALSTMNNYLSTLNKYLFKNIEDFKNIKTSEVTKVEKLIKRFIVTDGSYKNLQLYLNDFFESSKLENIFLKNLTLVSYPKSLILNKEVDLILDKIKDIYMNKQEIKKLTLIHKRNILDLKIMFLISYYSGLRKSEIYSRLYKDIKVIISSDSQLNVFINVDKYGLKKLGKNLKTKSSKRNVHFIVNNKKHEELFLNWHQSVEVLLTKKIDKSKLSETKKVQKLRTSNIFINDKKRLNDKIIIYESKISIISKAIKFVTQRYCTFHSCRHSYQTYKYKEILSKQQSDPYLAIEQSIQLGHRTPSMGINSYTHYDVINDI